jgi:hypothetical protein
VNNHCPIARECWTPRKEAECFQGNVDYSLVESKVGSVVEVEERCMSAGYRGYAVGSAGDDLDWRSRVGICPT